MTATLPRLYDDLAAWWPLLSPPDEYDAEAAMILSCLLSSCLLFSCPPVLLTS